jgi:hypothetical protein
MPDVPPVMTTVFPFTNTLYYPLIGRYGRESGLHVGHRKAAFVCLIEI